MGPTAMVLLRNRLIDKEVEDIKQVLKEISEEVEKDEIWDWEFSVTDTTPISGKYKGEGRPFGLLIKELDLEAKQLIILEKEFGFQPQQEIELDAMCNSKEDHRILGELLLYLAQRYNSIIDFNGAILPPTISVKQFLNSSWDELSNEFNFWVKDMPGRIYSLEYFTGGNKLWASHIADTVFLQFWLTHPHFHMIK